MAYPTTGLFILYRCNEASGSLIDYSGNARNGTVTGTGVYGAAGEFAAASAILTDAAGEGVYGGQDAIGAAMSYYGRFYLQNDIGDGNTFCHFAKCTVADPTNYVIEFGLFRSGANRFFYLRSGPENATAFLQAVTVNATTWYGAGFSLAGGTVRFYLDGAQVGSAQNSFDLGNDSDAFITFGGRNNGTSSQFTLGGVQRFQMLGLWNREMTAQEFADADAWAGELVPCSPANHYYRHLSAGAAA